MYWKNWDRTDAATTRERQGAILHKFLKTQVLLYSPFYKEIFKKENLTADDIRSVEDLRKIPFTSKADIAPTADDPGKPRRLVLQPDPDTYSGTISLGKKLGLLRDKILTGREMKDLVLDEYFPVFFIATTGRTANPTSFMYTTHDMALFREAAKRLLILSGIKRGEDFVFSIFPYAPHLAFWIVYQAGIQTGVPAFHSGGGKILGTEKIINMIEKTGSTIVVGIPGYVYHLLRLAAEQGRDYSKIRAIVLGAERVTKGYKKRIHELLTSMGARDPVILSTYGFTEARAAWMECPCENSIEDSTGYHLYPDMHIFEIIDSKTGEPVGNDESGEIVMTTLDWRGSVVIRYRTGDFARGGITMKPCPGCGRTVPRLSTDITRLSDVSKMQLSKVKGTLVDFNEFFPILNDLSEIVEWQIEITKRNNDPHDLDEIHLHLSTCENCDCDDLLKIINSSVVSRMEIKVAKFNFQTTGEMTKRLEMEDRPKEMRILDRRKELEENN